MTSKGLKTVYQYFEWMTNMEWYVTNSSKLKRHHQHRVQLEVIHVRHLLRTIFFFWKTACQKYFCQILSPKKTLSLWISRIGIRIWSEESTLSVDFMDSWSVFGFSPKNAKSVFRFGNPNPCIHSAFEDGIGTLETLRLRFGHVTASNKLRFAVNGFTLPVCPYLALVTCRLDVVGGSREMPKNLNLKVSINWWKTRLFVPLFCFYVSALAFFCYTALGLCFPDNPERTLSGFTYR